MQERTDQGLWWFPGAEETAVAGTLTIKDGYFPKLDLIGALTELQQMTQDFSPDIILGVAGGSYVTLYRCVRVGGRLQMPGIYSESYSASFALRGAHFDTAASIRFSKMRHSYDALFEWAGLSGMTMEIVTDAHGHLGRVGAQYEFPVVPEFRIEDATLTLRAAAAVDGGPRSQHLTIKQALALEVVPTSPLSIEAYLERYFHDLANFLALAAGGAIRTTEVTAEVMHEPGAQADSPTHVTIAYRSRGGHVNREWQRHDMLFTLDDIREEAEQALQLWLSRAEVLRPVYDLYFGTVFQERPYIHQRFLSLAQALESYHRRLVGGTHLPTQDFDGLLREFLEVLASTHHPIDGDARSAFTDKLRYLNEVSLRRRLRELVQSRAGVARLLIRDVKRFVDRVVHTRNYYTHYDDASRDNAVTENQLPLLADQMQFLLELCLLTEIGLNDDILTRISQRQQRYAALRQSLDAFDPVT